MRMVHELTNTIDSNHFILKGVKIGGVVYDLSVENYGGILSISFIKGEFNTYTMTVTPEDVRFKRCVRRINHDHDDYEYLTGVDNDGTCWRKLKWDEVKDKVMKIPFGMRIGSI